MDRQIIIKNKTTDNSENTKEKIRIMIVDDEVDYLNVLSKIFIEMGYAVETALDGKSAIAKILKAPPHLMLLDVRMPGEWGGPETLKWTKKISPDTKVIMLSAVGDPEMIKEAYELGANGYMHKPFNLENVKEALEWSLGEKEKRLLI